MKNMLNTKLMASILYIFRLFLNNNHNIIGAATVDMFKIWQPNVLTATIVQGPDHVILTGLQMMNLVSNFEYLEMLSFLTNGNRVLKFGAPSRYNKGALM